MRGVRSFPLPLYPGPLRFHPLPLAVQGLGGGGILNLSLIIVSDLVPLSQRGFFQGLIFLAFSFANAIGPLIVRKLSSL